MELNQDLRLAEEVSPDPSLAGFDFFLPRAFAFFDDRLKGLGSRLPTSTRSRYR